MDVAAARARLQNMVAWENDPVLNRNEISQLLDLSRIEDKDGRGWDEALWIPTFDLYAAAAEGWTWKAGKVAGEFNFQADGSSFSKGQKHAHCLKQAEHYRNKSAALPKNLRSQGQLALNRNQPGSAVIFLDTLGS